MRLVPGNDSAGQPRTGIARGLRVEVVGVAVHDQTVSHDVGDAAADTDGSVV